MSAEPAFELDLVATSVRAMLANQQENGSFVASPDFSQYNHCWLRDASFVAHALDLSGEVDASARFHRWTAAAIERVAFAMDDAVTRARERLALDPTSMPPARFSLAGLPVVDGWPNFQIDGYGIWLWSLEQHLARTASTELAQRVARAVECAARYVDALAFTPCFDVWEEDGTSIHTSTLACIHGGLVAAGRLLGDAKLAARAEEVRTAVLVRGHLEGRFPKSSSSRDIDASSVWLCEPFALVDADAPEFVATVAEIEERLEFGGGIRRYPGDTYYGGGAWPVLSASIGWNHVAVGDMAAARRHLDWIAGRFDREGRLAEQFGGERRDLARYDEWLARWGPPARELLWSHAMFVILAAEVTSQVENSETDRTREGDRKGSET